MGSHHCSFCSYSLIIPYIQRSISWEEPAAKLCPRFPFLKLQHRTSHLQVCAFLGFCPKIHTSHSCMVVLTMHVHSHACLLDDTLLHNHTYPGSLTIVPFVLSSPWSSSATVKFHDQFRHWFSFHTSNGGNDVSHLPQQVIILTVVQ